MIMDGYILTWMDTWGTQINTLLSVPVSKRRQRTQKVIVSLGTQRCLKSDDRSLNDMEDGEMQECLRRVAGKLRRSEWKFLAIRLGLSEADIDDISKAYPGNYSRQKDEMLSLWKRNFREYATSERLTRALREMDRGGGKDSQDKRASVIPSRHVVRYGPSVDPPQTVRRYNDFLSSTVQVRGVPSTMHWREQAEKHHKRSESSMSGQGGRLNRRESKWTRAVSAPPSKQSKITIEVDIQSIMTPRPHESCDKGGQAGKSTTEDGACNLSPTKQKWNGHPLPYEGALPKVHPARKVRCRCAVHRRRDKETKDSDDEEEEEEGGDSKDPFGNLLSSLRDPFFKRLIQSSSEIDTAVDHLERLKGVFVDDTKLKCIQFICRCTDIRGLEELWSRHQSGHLTTMLQTSLVTDQSLASVGACAVTLEARICEDEYQRCKTVLSVVTGKKLKTNSGRPRNLTSLVIETLFFNVCQDNLESVSKYRCVSSQEIPIKE